MEQIDTEDLFHMQRIELHIGEGIVFMNLIGEEESITIFMDSRDAIDFSSQLWVAADASEADDWEARADEHLTLDHHNPERIN